MNYFEVKVNYSQKSIADVLAQVGLNDDGSLQVFHTNNVLKRMVKYMPAQSGALMKLTVAQTDITKPYIVTDAPQARYLFYGMLMVDPETKKGAFYNSSYGFWSRPGVAKELTDTPLNFDKSINAKAGPRWDLAVTANEMPIMIEELQSYADLLAERDK